MAVSSSPQYAPIIDHEQIESAGKPVLSEVISDFKAIQVRYSLLLSANLGLSKSSKRQIQRLIDKMDLSLKKDRSKDISESLLAKLEEQLRPHEKAYQSRRISALQKSNDMLALAEQCFLSLQTQDGSLLSSHDQANHVCNSIEQARQAQENNNGAVAINAAQHAINQMIDDRQHGLRREDQQLPEGMLEKLISVLSNRSSRVNHRLFQLSDIENITATATRQGVNVVKIALLGKGKELSGVLSTLASDADQLLAESTLQTQSGLNLFRISVDPKCTLYLAAIPIERFSFQLEPAKQFSLVTAEVLNQFQMGLVYTKDPNNVDYMEKTAMAMCLLRLPDKYVRLARKDSPPREELVALFKSL